ncbi:MAG: tRNA pseudouridine(55) synthase TruB [Alphaproteobacteria bacterium]|nr:tRNA pseudouridine(55) synthase TruB [Alphaproteobacteria bacterium]
MARTKRGKPINGWIVVDKPAGITSAQVVARVKRALGASKVGHGGTLDPLATGVLPIACGEATKTVTYVMDGIKTYWFRVRWGEGRDTDDAEGAVIATSDHRPTREGILAALPSFVGEIEQVPPIFSAIKVDGQRAYDLARADKPVTLVARPVFVRSFELVEMPDVDHADFKAVCGKGTYVRSLARDLARAVGTHGHVVSLRRARVGPFSEERAIPLDKLESIVHTAPASDYLLSVATALDDIPALALTGAEAHRLSQGQPLAVTELAARVPLDTIGADATVRAMLDGRVVALARIEGGEVRSLRNMNL